MTTADRRSGTSRHVMVMTIVGVMTVFSCAAWLPAHIAALAPSSGQPFAQQTEQQNPPPSQDPPPKPLDMIKLEASYDEILLPIFEDSCADCHDAGEAERELQLMEFSTFLRGSINGAILEPGKAEESKLFQVLQAGHDPHMPPDAQLEKDDIERIKTWINELPPALKEKLGRKKDDG